MDCPADAGPGALALTSPRVVSKPSTHTMKWKTLMTSPHCALQRHDRTAKYHNVEQFRIATRSWPRYAFAAHNDEEMILATWKYVHQQILPSIVGKVSHKRLVHTIRALLANHGDALHPANGCDTDPDDLLMMEPDNDELSDDEEDDDVEVIDNDEESSLSDDESCPRRANGTMSVHPSLASKYDASEIQEMHRILDQQLVPKTNADLYPRQSATASAAPPSQQPATTAKSRNSWSLSFRTSRIHRGFKVATRHVGSSVEEPVATASSHRSDLPASSTVTRSAASSSGSTIPSAPPATAALAVPRVAHPMTVPSKERHSSPPSPMFHLAEDDDVDDREVDERNLDMDLEDHDGDVSAVEEDERDDAESYERQQMLLGDPLPPFEQVVSDTIRRSPSLEIMPGGADGPFLRRPPASLSTPAVSMTTVTGPPPSGTRMDGPSGGSSSSNARVSHGSRDNSTFSVGSSIMIPQRPASPITPGVLVNSPEAGTLPTSQAASAAARSNTSMGLLISLLQQWSELASFYFKAFVRNPIEKRQAPVTMNRMMADALLFVGLLVYPSAEWMVPRKKDSNGNVPSTRVRQRLTLEYIRETHNVRQRRRVLMYLTGYMILMRCVSFDFWVFLMLASNAVCLWVIKNSRLFSISMAKRSLKNRVGWAKQYFGGWIGAGGSGQSPMGGTQSAADPSGISTSKRHGRPELRHHESGSDPNDPFMNEEYFSLGSFGLPAFLTGEDVSISTALQDPSAFGELSSDHLSHLSGSGSALYPTKPPHLHHAGTPGSLNTGSTQPTTSANLQRSQASHSGEAGRGTTNPASMSSLSAIGVPSRLKQRLFIRSRKPAPATATASPPISAAPCLPVTAGPPLPPSALPICDAASSSTTKSQHARRRSDGSFGLSFSSARTRAAVVVPTMTTTTYASSPPGAIPACAPLHTSSFALEGNPTNEKRMLVVLSTESAVPPLGWSPNGTTASLPKVPLELPQPASITPTTPASTAAARSAADQTAQRS
ncbi:hypothetical protein CXG81DRAFT_16873 [Caulochytrium protostelioides]|nr:hypothetical protein CXG81DRAFT_16873 [Caulochytrium protostelioides]|eukprot:RKP03642.1 hypothetical protein CXG81DRAFT_16873 [Caulochytrium protostelioides]